MKSNGDLLFVRLFWLLNATLVFVCLCRCHCSPQSLIHWRYPAVNSSALSNFPRSLVAAHSVPPVGSGGGRRLCRGRHFRGTGKLMSSCCRCENCVLVRSGRNAGCSST